jgi:hypothetical protein
VECDPELAGDAVRIQKRIFEQAHGIEFATFFVRLDQRKQFASRFREADRV